MANSWSKLTTWSKSLAGLGTLTKQTAEQAAPELQKLALKTYSAEQDPYQRKWKPRKGNYSWPILDRSGKMKGKFKFGANRGSVTAENTASYSQFHQHGTRHMAARLILPTQQAGLPKTWAAEIRKLATKNFHKRFK